MNKISLQCFIIVAILVSPICFNLKKILLMRENFTPPAQLSLHAGKLQAITNPHRSTPNTLSAYA